MQDLTQYYNPGDGIYYEGTQLWWSDVTAGWPDNIVAHGQVFTYNDPSVTTGMTKIGFLGTATNGPSCGNVIITYTDNSTSSSQICFSDWTLNGSKQYMLANDQYFYGEPTRNKNNGTTNAVPAYIFYTEVPVTAGETLKSVQLPTSVTAGQIHIFSFAPGKGSYNTNVGMTNDSDSHRFANLDGGHYSYSANAMQKAGMVPVTLPMSTPGYDNYLNSLAFNGAEFYWDQNGSVFTDNAIASGQTLSLDNPTPDEDAGSIPVNPMADATDLAFLGTATGGGSVGTGTIIYSDGFQQTFTLGFSDWCATTVGYGNSITLTMPYRSWHPDSYQPSLLSRYTIDSRQNGNTGYTAKNNWWSDAYLFDGI
jgi:hypothetical protein